MLGFKKICCDKRISTRQRTTEAPLRCPRCAIVMDKETKGDVTIDICGTCHGMWLDDKEIERLLSQSNANNDAVSSTGPKKGNAKKRKNR